LSLIAGVCPVYGQSNERQGKIKDTIFPKVDSLKAVIVRPNEVRPRLRGDTAEYNTGSILMRANANVEELLGRLPGLHIDANGTITYNGEVIKQLLVDGEDLFGSDPTIVTRNFDASRIARVQLLDRKSDKAQFSGIDDGNRTKTLNLVLKEDSKKGYFGKVEAGADVGGIYGGNGLLGSFRQREQVAVLGFASNTGSSGFSSGSGSASIIELNGNDDPLGASAGRGIPRFLATALHYANTWNGEDNHLVGNYQYSNLLTRPVTTTNTIQTLRDSIYAQDQHAESVNRQNQHWGYGIYDWAVNSLSVFKFTFHYSNTVADNRYSDTGLSTFNDINVNRTARIIQSMGNRANVGGGVNWRIQSRKKAGRILSILTDLTYVKNSTDGYLYSLNRFYQPDGELQAADTVDQRKQITNQTQSFSGGLTFAEPLWGKNVLGLNYGLFYNGNESLQATYDKGDGKYQDFVDSLSSHYDGYNLNQMGSLSLQSNGRGLQYTLAMGMLSSSYRQKDLLADKLLNYQYLNFTPNLLINYTPNSTTRFGVKYDGSTQPPGFTQLQPVRNNSDPLHIMLGNPSLRPGFIQNMGLQFSSTRTWLLNLSLNLGLTSNSISTKTTTDSLGRQVSQPVNVDGGRNLRMNFSVNKKLLGIDVGLNSRIGYSRNVNYINTDLARNDSYTGSGGFKLGKYVPEKYSIQLEGQFTYFNSRSSVNIAAPVHYWAQSHTGNLTLFFIRGFDINTNAIYTWQQKSSAFAKNNSVMLWNASVLRNFLSNRLVLKLQANNLLNQNAGISRTNTGNINTETSTNILGRYWLLSLAYRFDHKYKVK
jgi:hypothetical protein